MSSSKQVDSPVRILRNVIDFTRLCPDIVTLNLRPEQRPEEDPDWFSAIDRGYRNHTAFSDGELISDDFERFLSQIIKPIMVVILYQDYGTDLFTVVVELQPIICWDRGGLPRLDFKEPTNWNMGNLWGGFVLATAEVQNCDSGPIIADPNAETFIKISTQYGVVTPSPCFRTDFALNLGREFYNFDRGYPVEHRPPGDKSTPKVTLGDQCNWEAGQNQSGTARIVNFILRPDDGETTWIIVRT